MSSDAYWSRMTLRDAGVTLIDCDHRTPKAQAYGYPYIAIPQLKDGHIHLDGSERRISASDFEDWTKKLLPQQHDVIVVRRCNSGDSAVVPAGLTCAIGQNLVILRADGSKVFRPFLRWLIKSNEWWEQVSKYLNVGAVFDSLKCKEIPLFELPIPPLNVQESIAQLLQSLDDRITLLRETNKTLESIAQAIFKSWFVDFDPVRAKMEGRQPEGMDEETAALFPDSFEESELGLRPRGWHVKPIGDLVPTMGGATPSTKNEEFWSPAEFHWSSPKDLSGINSPVLLETEKKVSAAGLKKISSGLMPVGTLLMSSRAPIGYLAISAVPIAINQGYIAIPAGGTLSPLYMLFWCKTNMETIKGNANGSTFMEISKKAFRPILAIEPTTEILNAFEGVAGALFQRLKANEEQAQMLTTLRDTLLPRLISGQLRLPEAQKQVEDALS